MPPNCFRLGGNDKDRKKKRWQQNQLECHFPPLSMLAEPWARPIGAQLCPTAPSHHPECVSKGTQSSRLRIERWPGLPCFKTKQTPKKRKKGKEKENNTIQKTSLFSFQRFKFLWHYAALQPCQLSRILQRKESKDVQIKQETRYMLLCANTALHQGTEAQSQSMLRCPPSSSGYWKHGLWFILDACIDNKCMHLSTARELPCKTAFVTEKKWLTMLKFQLWKANNSAARKDEGTCSGLSVLSLSC